MQRFEQQYSITAREKEIKQVLQFVIHGQSCQIISVPGAGRSTVLRLLAYHYELVKHHLTQLSFRAKSRNLSQPNADERDPSTRRSSSVGMTGGYLFVYLNFAEIANFATAELHKSLFLSILSSMEGNPKLHKELYELFTQALKLNDPQVFFQNLKKSILTIEQSSNQAMVFLFDRFSEFADKITSDFFTSLRSLRTASGGKLAIVFSTHRPLENLLAVEHWQDFYEFFVGNHIFLELYDKEATGFRIEVLEKEYNKKLPPKTKEEIIKLTAGHAKLVKLATQILLSSNGHPELGSGSHEMPKRVRHDNLNSFLLSHILIRGSLLEIWQSLTSREKETLKEYIFNNETIQQLNNTLLPNLHLPFPLLTEFIKRNIADELIPKTIRFSGKQNEIYFGDEPLSDLTNYEFRLLKYLIDNPNRVCGRDEIITAVWSESKTQQGVSDEALDQMVHRLRKKIEDEADNPKHLLTVKGRGFRFLP